MSISRILRGRVASEHRPAESEFTVTFRLLVLDTVRSQFQHSLKMVLALLPISRLLLLVVLVQSVSLYKIYALDDDDVS